MRRNPLLYSEPSEIEQSPAPTHTPAPQEKTGKSSILFYFIILANSLLVIFVLGFIWFLFFKSPDIQIKDLSDRFFGLVTPSKEQPVQTKTAPQAVQTVEPKPPTQQEKDEIQQTKLKEMREEKEALAAERVRLESIKNELEKERLRASEAQQAVNDLEKSKEPAPSDQQEVSYSQPESTQTNEVPSATAVKTNNEVVVTETPTPEPSAASVSSEEPKAAKEPDTNTTDSQVDLIIEALKNQQQEQADNN